MKTNMRIYHEPVWKRGRSLTLIFGLLMAFFFHGWYATPGAEAGISTLSAWTSLYTNTGSTSVNTYYTVPPSTTGGNRLLVVGVSSVRSTATNTLSSSATYGGQTMTAVASNFTVSTSRYHTSLYYLNDSGLVSAGTNTQLSISLTGGAGIQYILQVDAAVYDGVVQTVSTVTGTGSWNNNGTQINTIGPISPTMPVNAGNKAVEIVQVTRGGSATPRTINTWGPGWSSTFGPTLQTYTSGTNHSTNLYIGEFTVPSSNVTTTSQHTASGTAGGAMSAMSINNLLMNLQLGNTTNPTGGNVGQDTLSNPLDGFTMSATAGQFTINSIAFRGNTTFNNGTIAGINVYQDNGTLGTLDLADVLIPSTVSAINASNTTTITFTTPVSVTTATASYLVVTDITATAAISSTLTGTVISAVGSFDGATIADTNSATLTIQTAPGLAISNGTNPGNAFAETTSMNNALDGFGLATANSNGTSAIDTLVIRGTFSFDSATIADVHVYKDNGTAGLFEEGTDVLMPSSATTISGLTTTLTFNPPIYVTGTTPVNYLVVVDITGGALLNSSFTGTVIQAVGHGLATPTYTDSGSATLTVKKASKITSCASCHTYPPLDGQRTRTTGAVTGDHQKHTGRHPVYVCSTCHVAPAGTTSAYYSHQTGTVMMQAGATAIMSGYYDKNNNAAYNAGADDTFAQSPTNVTSTCRNIACHGGNNPTPIWGVGTATCISCHNGVVTALTASLYTNGVVTNRDNAVSEFGLAWGHKKTGRSAVNDRDCIVCHLEGNFSSQQTATIYHANGYIDLRDPDGAGETRITNISGATFSFIQFAMSFAAGSRSSTGHLSDTDIANVLTQKFCLACHDSNGATNPTARSSNGVSAPTATNPFAEGNLGANYTVTNGSVTGGTMVDVKTQFTYTLYSAHPVLGPLNHDFPSAARMKVPYNNNGSRPGTSGTKTLSVVLNCFDCHNNATVLLTRTNVAHGASTTPLRAQVYINAPNLCNVCHSGYVSGETPGTDTQHGAGSAMATNGNGGEGMITVCHNCHGSSITAAQVRPIRAQDWHGHNSKVGGGLWPQTNSRPYAFIRANWGGTGYHRPFRSTEFTAGSAICNGTGVTTPCQVGNGQNQNYTPGGSY